MNIHSAFVVSPPLSNRLRLSSLSIAVTFVLGDVRSLPLFVVLTMSWCLRLLSASFTAWFTVFFHNFYTCTTNLFATIVSNCGIFSKFIFFSFQKNQGKAKRKTSAKVFWRLSNHSSLQDKVQICFGQWSTRKIHLWPFLCRYWLQSLLVSQLLVCCALRVSK